MKTLYTLLLLSISTLSHAQCSTEANTVQLTQDHLWTLKLSKKPIPEEEYLEAYYEYLEAKTAYEQCLQSH